MSKTLIDSHTHVGRFADRYFAPKKIAKFLMMQGVLRFVVTPTSAACNLHEEGEDALRELMEVQGIETAMLLWVTPNLLLEHKNLTTPLKALPYAGLKLHPYANHWTDAELKRVLKIADDLRFPVLAHTGGNEESDAGRWLRLLGGHECPVVLAHGRPVGETIEVLAAYECACTDTAFMPIADLKILLAGGYAHRVLFGSDIPIDQYYRSSSPSRRYKARVAAVTKTVAHHAEAILEKTAESIFFSKAGKKEKFQKTS